MFFFSKVKRAILIIIVVMIIGMGSIGGYIFWKTDAYTQRNIILQAPHGPVEIKLSDQGIPHILSKSSDLDAFYALGYIHAKDRFWQMEFQRHVVKGNLSQLFGKATLVQDKYLRTWGFYRSAKKSWDKFDSKTQKIVESYTAGVNAYFDTGKLPLQLILLRHKPEVWTNTDSYAWGKMLAWQLQNSWLDKIRNYFLREKYGEKENQNINTPYPSDAPIILSQDDLIQEKIDLKPDLKTNTSMQESKRDVRQALLELTRTTHAIKDKLNIHDVPGKGSNNWVVSGRRTKSGKPILANDIHLELSVPGTWYLAELQAPTLHVTGATLPGIPGVIVGHNDYIAWGITDAAVDAQDIYFVPEQDETVEIHEKIDVKGSDTVNFVVEVTSDGSPIINDLLDSGKKIAKIAIKWTALTLDDTSMRSIQEIDYAKNWEEFKQALRYFIAPSQNFIFADTAGNIGYYLSGKIPIRTWSGRYPVSMDASHRWKGYIPFEQMPHVYNPKSGYIASANNKIVPDSYAYHLTYQWRGMPYRIERIVDMLNQNDLLDIPAMMNMQNDIYSRIWFDFRSILLKTVPLDTPSRDALNDLLSWDGYTDYNSKATTIFSFWLQELLMMQPHPPADIFDMPNPLFVFDQLRKNSEFCQVNAATKNCSDFLSQSLQRAMEKLISALGKNKSKWNWGSIHQACFKDPIFGGIKGLGWIWNRSIKTGGDGYTLNVGAYAENFKQIAGANYRQMTDLSDINTSYFMSPIGQSGNPLSPHYQDQLKLWATGEYIKK